MVCLSALQRTALIVPIVLGTVSGIMGSYLLAFIAVVSLLAMICLLQPLKGHRFIFMFFLLFLTCLPINIRASRDLFFRLYDGEAVAMDLTLCVLFAFALFGIESIISGILLYFLYGEQDDKSIAEKEKQLEEDYEIGFQIKCNDKICTDIQREIDRLDQGKYKDEPGTV